MCDLWRDEIPSDLQRDFERQIDERVNSAIMDQVASSIGTSAINEIKRRIGWLRQEAGNEQK